MYVVWLSKLLAWYINLTLDHLCSFIGKGVITAKCQEWIRSLKLIFIKLTVPGKPTVLSRCCRYLHFNGKFLFHWHGNNSGHHLIRIRLPRLVFYCFKTCKAHVSGIRKPIYLKGIRNKHNLL